MIRKILRSKDPILRLKSKPIAGIDKKVRQIVTDLKDTLSIQKDPEGVGLAAPQIGKNIQIFVCNYKDFNRVVINPKILSIAQMTKAEKGKKVKNEILEGCLSLPYYYGPLKRAKKVEVEYLNEKGEKINLNTWVE